MLSRLLLASAALADSSWRSCELSSVAGEVHCVRKGWCVLKSATFSVEDKDLLGGDVEWHHY